MLKQLAECDWFGIAIALSWGVCFILGLEWGVRLLSLRSNPDHVYSS